MRLFKSSNKSQASIDPTPSSRSSSPDPAHTRSSYAGGAHQYADRPGFSQPPLQPTDDQHLPYPQDSQGQSHPAHVLSRGSSELPGYVEGGGRRPSVPINLIPPTSPQPIHVQVPDHRGPAPIPGHTQFGQSKHVHVPVEKEHKRSKRSIFGLSKDKDKDKDKENLHSPTEKKGGLGRSGSIHLLRKSHHPQPSGDHSVHSPSSPQYNNRQSYFGKSEQSLENSPEDPSHYEQYRQQQYQAQQQQSQQQYDSPSSQYSQRFGEYQDQAQVQGQIQAQHPQSQPQPQPHFPPPPQSQEAYQAYQQTTTGNSSDHYLPYQQQGVPQGRPANIVAAEQHANLRPPSQSSLGPPSPIGGPPPSESRPSTAQTSRYSVQSVGQGQNQQQHMARGDPPNGSTRQQIPQRDPREEHGQYQHDPRIRMSHQQDQGRSTPPPQRSAREDVRDMDYGQLLQKHEELQQKYSKVKRYYFEREAQVTQLQNTVATQRLSMSKTSLDDAQYSQRFERLSGAINNLAFNIRKDWKKVPPWLQTVCNADAHAIGTKEMTAVGRTCITRWLNDTLFRQTFHPGIPPEVSTYLKAIESNLRNQSSSGLMFTDEQRDDHLNKLTSWRLTTIEGLAPYLNSKESAHFQESLTQNLTTALTGSLQANLKDPPPPGLSEGVATIISQAVSLAANIPLESRDIVISYFMPGEMINENLMKVESGMTALTNPGSGNDSSAAIIDDDDSVRGPPGRDSVEEQIREAAAKATQSGAQPGQGQGARADSVSSATSTLKGGADKGSGSSGGGAGGNGKQKGGSSFLGGFVSKKPAPQQSSGSSAGVQQGRSAGAGISREQLQAAREQAQQQQQQDEQGVDGGVGGGPPQAPPQQQQIAVNPNLRPGEGRIRFSAFLAVEVRGKMGDSRAGGAGGKDGAGQGQQGGAGGGSVLFKAPVFEL